MFPMANDAPSIEYQEVKLPMDHTIQQSSKNLTIHQSLQKPHQQQNQLNQQTNREYQTLQRGSVDTQEGANHSQSKSKEYGFGYENEDDSKIKVNLPGSRNSRKRRSEYQTIEN